MLLSRKNVIISYGVRGGVVERADLWSRNTNIAGSNPVGHPIVRTWTIKIKYVVEEDLLR